MYVYIRLTEKCNLNCEHCFNNIRTNKIIDFDKLKVVLTNLNKRFNNNIFIIHGGEPLLVNTKDIIKLINDFPNNKWQITTNLIYDLTDDMISLFKLINILRISFDIKIRFNNFRNLHTWVKNIKILKQNNIDINLNLCLTKYLINHSISSFINFINRLDTKTYRLEILRYHGNVNCKSQFVINNNQIDDWIFDLYKYDKTDNRCINIQEIKHCINSKNSFYKTCCNNTLTINSDLSIGNCPAYTSNNSKLLLDEILHNHRKIRNECLICDYYQYCRGWCNKMNWTNNICPFPKKLANEILEGMK